MRFAHLPLSCKSTIKQAYFLLLRAYFAWIKRKMPVITPSHCGINLIGYYRAELGLGEALRYLAFSMQAKQLVFLVRKLLPKLRTTQSNMSLQAWVQPYCDHPINCIAINPDVLYRLPFWLERSEWTQRYNIAYWFWELEQFPQAWRYALAIVDEIWVSTEFNAKTMRAVHPRVTKIPFAVEFDLPSAHLDRAYFGLPDQCFIFLTSFDFHSFVERKNPQATIAAFLQAFPDRQIKVNLLIKSTNGQNYPEQYQAIQALAQQDRRIIFLDQQLSSEENRGLLHCADCYVSLHRAEGLGLGLAESMYLGKPVIATNYSGNLEFMNPSNSCLVDFELIPVLNHQYPHSTEQVWAQADTQDAASYMQALFHDPQKCAHLGQQASSDMRKYHSYSSMGDGVAQRLEQLIHDQATQAMI
jgi:glycosyltransferase involved in cell wall biosynthesis